MDSNPHETRPLKRRRVEMAPPDGFTATPTPKPVYKPVVPQFSSAFNEDYASVASTFKPSSSDKESTDNLGRRRPVPSNPFIIQGSDKLKESNQVLHALASSKPGTRLCTSKERPSTFLPTLHGSLIPSQLKTDAPNLQLRPPPKPPIMPSYHTPITTSVLLKPAVPPLPLLANKHSSKDLKSLQPPPVPLPSNPVTEGKNFRTISKTRVALATDLSTDTGVAELASIFLHDQHPDITLPNSHPDKHDGRGLGLSPERKGKGKSSKFVRCVLFSYCLGKESFNFIRGGLAARASAFFEQSQTSLVLWQKETERRAYTFSSSDLRVSIIKILQKPLCLDTASQKLVSPGIALCRIQRETNNTDPYHKSYNFDDLYRIVFSFPSCLTKSIFNDPLRFSEGRSIRICSPWQEISFTEESRSSTSNLPASLPMPSSEPTLTPDVAVNDKALLCSRFFIL